MNFIHLEGHPPPLRITGKSDSHFRVNGKWISKKSTTIRKEIDDDLINTLDLLTTSLPGWPLVEGIDLDCLLYTSPSPRDMRRSRMPSSA